MNGSSRAVVFVHMDANRSDIGRSGPVSAHLDENRSPAPARASTGTSSPEVHQ